MNTPANDAEAAISQLSPRAAKLLAVEILLADPKSLGDDVLESCLYIFRDRLKGGIARPGRRTSSRVLGYHRRPVATS